MESKAAFRNTLERWLTLISLIISSTFFLIFMYLNVSHAIDLYLAQQTQAALETIVFTLINTLFAIGNVIYFLVRYGRLQRQCEFDEELRTSPDYASDAKLLPPVTILVPAFKEDISIITMSLLSCIFQEYPRKRVVLLIDNPPDPKSLQDKQLLDETRNIPECMTAMLQPMCNRITKEWTQFEGEKHLINCSEAAKVQSVLFREAAQWFEKLRRKYLTNDHSERFFAKVILDTLVRKCYSKADSIKYKAQQDTASVDEIEHGYRYLHSLFSVELVSFERKTFQNLSHEPNKAMNVNSYLGLIGKTFSITHDTETQHKQYLTSDPSGTFVVPSADYVIAIDADSIILTEYAVRLVTYLEKPGNQHVALVQTPYKPSPNSPNLTEYFAGLTMDIQYLMHEGFAFYDATCWVGENGVIRMKALKNIEMVDCERGYSVLRYIRDRTVIEDIETSMVLLCKGWKLYNYPGCFTYSAMAQDFGSLLIQRRRWATGGLIIFPNVIRYFLFGNASFLQRLVRFVMRFSYLLLGTLLNFGVLISLIYPFGGELHIELMIISTIPYFICSASDLQYLGYPIKDLIPLCAFQELLILINLGGFFKTIEQIILGKKIRFQRTPKIKGRTVAPAFYVLAEIFLCFYIMFDCVIDWYYGLYLNAIFSAISGLFMCYALIYFIGFDTLLQDGFYALLRPARNWPSVDKK